MNDVKPLTWEKFCAEMPVISRIPILRRYMFDVCAKAYYERKKENAELLLRVRGKTK